MYITRLTDLKKFTARVPLFRGDPASLSWLYRALSSLPPSVEELNITMDVIGRYPPDTELIYQWNRINWGSLNETLTLVRLPNLRRLILNFQVVGGYNEDQEPWVRAQLLELLLYQSGIVDVTLTDMYPISTGGGGRSASCLPPWLRWSIICCWVGCCCYGCCGFC